MYIDPNTGGLLFDALAFLFQVLAFLLVCAPALAVGGVVVYLVRKGKINSNTNSRRDLSNH